MDLSNTKIIVGGERFESVGEPEIAVENPATGEIIASVANANVGHARDAMDAAVASQKDWEGFSAADRASILRRAYEALLQNSDGFARLITLEMGKSFSEAKAEVKYAAEFLAWFAQEATRVFGRNSPSPAGRHQHIVNRRPVGPCLLITPWNFPLAMITRKVGPAFAAGCSVIIKPAEFTPLTALKFADLMKSCGLPNGVLSVLPTSNASALVSEVIKDERLSKLSFTGSTRIGKIIGAQGGQSLLKMSLELGGNAPFIVFDDADVDAAVAGAMVAKLRNIGQACTAANRFIVHSKVFDEFLVKLIAKVEKTQLGDGFQYTDGVGPMISKSARQGVHSLVRNAIEHGAECVLGGRILEGHGYFYPPTILTGAHKLSRISLEEIFGPVFSISTFKSEEEAFFLANNTKFGLASYIYTNDLNRSFRAMSQIKAGMLGVNTGLVSDPSSPFGGVRDSGFGREGGVEGIDEYLTTHSTRLLLSR